MKITFLEAEVPLTKTFSLENGQITKVGHPKIIDYTSHQLDVASPGDFARELREHATLGHCLLKGNVMRALTRESRAGTTDPNEPTQFIVLDLDGLKSISQISQFMLLIGLGHAGYVAQYSASMGVIPSRGLSAHVFVWLDRPHLPSALKQWLIHKNFQVPELRSGISLSRTGNALRWTLDISTCQADKLIYIAPPLLGPGVEDKFEGERIQLIEGQWAVELDLSGVSAEANRGMQQRTTDALRTAAGLEKKPWDRAKTTEGVTFMPKPDVATVTGQRDDGKYVHLNLNGGDSWGYWHHKDNPKFLYNFKGEPNYLLKEIVPDYWVGLRREARSELQKGGTLYLAFRDFDGSTYYNGTFDTAREELRIAPAKGEQQVRDWLTENGQPQPEVVPTYDLVYEPKVLDRVDLARKWVNTYQPSEIELRYRREPKVVAELPAIAHKWWLLALGDDEACVARFVNWCAGVLQLKEAMGTAWYLQGVEGTGKGLIFNEWLQPMLGHSNVVEKRMEELESEFTGFLDGKVLMFVDEADMDEARSQRMLESTFKNLITEPRISVRHMRQMHRVVPNLLNIVITSNRNGIRVSDSDRRYNVAPYQSVQPPKPQPPEMDEIRASVWPAYCYLMGLKVDRQMARTALDNDAKRVVAAKSRNSIEETAKAVLDGDLDYFRHYRPNDSKGLTSKEQDLGIEYTRIVDAMGAWDKLSRDELFVLFNWIVGGLSPAPAKFTKLLAHHNIAVGNRRREDKTFRGTDVNWKREA